MNPLTNAATHERITTDTKTTLFVDTKANSNKTRSLIDRIRTLMLDNNVPLREIATMTFTKKTKTELRDRLQNAFESVYQTSQQTQHKTNAVDEPPTNNHKRLATDALDDLNKTAISTLHSFAQRILTTHPIETNLPPLVKILDKIASSVAFDTRWSVLQQKLLDKKSLAEPVHLALATKIKLDHLRSLAQTFQSN